VALGLGFLQHENNTQLREKIQAGTLSSKDYYRQLLRIIYRFLFLMVTEERDLVYDPDDKSESTQKFKKIYLQFYSIARLRKLSESRYVYETQFNDLWQGLVQTFQLFEANGNGKKLGIQPLDGDLFSYNAITDLQDSLINNKLLLECIRNMNEFKDENKNLVAINYRSLDVEELGSVYEGLLELHPVIENIEASNSAHINFTFHEGTDRKTTGSYYTRPELVNELIKSALIPVIEERLKEHTGNKTVQAKALLKLKVCDAAAGSGHMLLAAARTIAWYLARVQSGEENPAPSVYRKCLREVIQHCIYAVDFNPDAVELCKLALWLEGHNSGKPLSFLDHKIRNGNSLVGVTDLAVLEQPIPDDAFNPVTGDVKEVCQKLKKDNATYRKTKQANLFSTQGQQIQKDKATLNTSYAEMENIEQDTVEAVQEVKKKFSKVRNSMYHEEKACHIWTAAFFKTYTSIDDPTNPSSEKLEQYFFAPTQYGRLVGESTALAEQHKFFHWPLEFPDVFEQGGFDVMLGNPPWERIKLQQQEFFATRDESIANASNSAARNKMINSLPDTNPLLFNEYEFAMHSADCTGKFLRVSGRCVLTAVGDINTYSIFSELTCSLVNKHGRTGIIVPTGIATDDSNKMFFGTMVENNRLVSLFDFENREAIFQSVHRMYKFSLLTISGFSIGKAKPFFGFFLTRIEHLHDNLRVFNLSKEDFLQLNPNTKTCPIFRTSSDAILTAKIYKRTGVFIDKNNIDNSWNPKFKTLFHMANDSKLFKTKNDFNNIESVNIDDGNIIDNVFFPLYESKMIWLYDHRYGTYEGVKDRNSTQIPTPSATKLSEPKFSIYPYYWVDDKNINAQLKDKDSEGKIKWEWDKKWYLGFRDITNVSNERTTIASIIPKSAVGNTMPLIFLETYNIALSTCLLISTLNNLINDYCARQKVGGLHLTYNYLFQLPIAGKEFYFGVSKTLIPKVLELIYSSWDIKAFADDIWKEADEDLKAAINKQWQENKEVTGGHEWQPPEWCEIDKAGCPLPPFKWDESRRAVLKAELDAIYAKLYGLTTEELRYILDPQDVYGADFPGETFRVLKEKEIRLYGEYRTRRLVLEAWERLNKE
jgi:hypothetical protein